ncbi:MAG: hypothetical protein ACYCX4_14220 [Bacillota bacterium]
MKKQIEYCKKDIKEIEDMMEKYSIKGPDKHPPYVHTSVTSEVIRDQYIASQFFFCKQELVESSVRVVIASFTNDKLRRFFAGLLKKYTSKLLEEEMELFGIPAPVNPTKIMPPVTGIHDLVDDDYMYRVIFDGLQGAAMVHARAFKQCTTNDRIRNLFKKLLLEEIDALDDLIKYGKLKGWVDPVPKFSQENK